MKSRILIILFSALFLWNCSSEVPIRSTPEPSIQANRLMSSEEAIATAQNALIDLGFSTASRSDKGASAYLYNPDGMSRSEIPDSLLYVVNFNEGGYALILADRAASINTIAISETGEFEDDDNPIFHVYLEGLLGDSLKPFLKNPCLPLQPIDPNPYMYDEDGNRIQIVTETLTYENYLPVCWSQLAPYNDFCPALSESQYLSIPERKRGQYNGKCVVGCVPVAMAQICAHNNKPLGYKGRSLNWDELTAYPTIWGLSPTNKEILSYFLAGIGKDVEAKYGVSTKASTAKALSTLKKYGYNSASRTNKKSRCISSLKNGEVVYTTAVDNTRDSGHAWVIDGLKEEIKTYRCYENGSLDHYYVKKVDYIYYYAFNWGWGSINHTYYLSENPYHTGSYVYDDDDNPTEIIYDSNFEYIVDLK